MQRIAIPSNPKHQKGNLAIHDTQKYLHILEAHGKIEDSPEEPFAEQLKLELDQCT